MQAHAKQVQWLLFYLLCGYKSTLLCPRAVEHPERKGWPQTDRQTPADPPQKKRKQKNPTKLESESVLQVVSIHSTVEHIPPNSYHNSQLSLAMGSLAEIYTPAKAGESCF